MDLAQRLVALASRNTQGCIDDRELCPNRLDGLARVSGLLSFKMGEELRLAGACDQRGKIGAEGYPLPAQVDLSSEEPGALCLPPFRTTGGRIPTRAQLHQSHPFEAIFAASSLRPRSMKTSARGSAVASGRPRAAIWAWPSERPRSRNAWTSASDNASD